MEKILNNQTQTDFAAKQQFFTCIGKGHGAPCLPSTRQEWEKLRRESWLAQMCARIERGDDASIHRHLFLYVRPDVRTYRKR